MRFDKSHAETRAERLLRRSLNCDLGLSERVAHAAATVRECPPPPDAESARHLAAALDALDEFRTAERFDDWVQAWTRATEHMDAFTRAFAIANGQRPAGS